MLEVDGFSWQLHNNKQCNYYWIFSSYVIHTLIALSLNTLLGWTDQSLDQYPFQLQTLNSQKLFRKPLYRTHIPWSAVLVNFGNGISVPEKIESTSINILWKFFIHIYFILMGHNAHLNSTKGLHQSKYIYKDKVNNITTPTLNIHFVKQLDLLFI